MAPPSAETKTSYDEIPYKSYPYPQSHPDRLATVATLFGMEPPPLDHCRVLELGCCTGGNLIPMAERFPGSRFVGIDYSQRQVAEGQAVVQALELKNIELQQRNILEIGPDFGEFDYVIAHGVYSWVPDDCRDKLLQICAQNLAPNGVAYVSYNTYPGWHMRGMIRDIMCYRARSFEKPVDRLHHARALLDFLSQSVPTEENAFGILLKNELNLINDKEDNYLLHEFLEDVNEPVYFYEFIERAEAKGLQYLGESDFRVMSVSNFPRQIEAMLNSVASNMIQLEQYMDFVRNRMFRQTLLCRKEISLDRTLSPQRVVGLHVASSAKPEGDVDIHATDQVTFRGPNSVMNTNDRLVKAAMLHLGEIWPRSLPFANLLATARSRLNPDPVVVDTAQVTHDGRRLAEPIIRCYATTQIELAVHPPSFTLEISDRPTASRLSRFQAEKSNNVTNLRHESVQLNDIQRHVLKHLDGQHDRNLLMESLTKLVTTEDSGFSAIPSFVASTTEVSHAAFDIVARSQAGSSVRFRRFHLVFCQFLMRPWWSHTGRCQAISSASDRRTVLMRPWHDLLRQRTPESSSSVDEAPVAALRSSVKKLASLRAGPGIEINSPVSSR